LLVVVGKQVAHTVRSLDHRLRWGTAIEMEAWAVLTPSGQNGPESGRKRTPSDVVNHEIVQGFEKHSVVPPLVAPS
jgi:hypothetical protein